MKSALNSLEPNHNGFISQSFLGHELENGLNAADRTTKHLVSKTNATIAKVSHIVDLPDLNDSGFHEQNQKALKEISTTPSKERLSQGRTKTPNNLETISMTAPLLTSESAVRILFYKSMRHPVQQAGRLLRFLLILPLRQQSIRQRQT